MTALMLNHLRKKKKKRLMALYSAITCDSVPLIKMET